MKKLLALVLAFSMSLTMGTVAFAATNWDPNPGLVRESDSNPDIVPMYGYIGPVVENPVDPDPDNPIVNPWKGLNLSVPVKFMWAAFEPETDGDLTAPVEAPKYNIINNSDEDAIKVYVANFHTDTPLASTVGTLDIILKQDTTATATIDADVTLLNKANDVTYTSPKPLGTIATEETWTFSVGGEFEATTAWPEEVQLPEYRVEFTFKVDAPVTP